MSQFKDIYDTKVDISTSRSGYIRVDFKGDGFPIKIDKIGHEIPYCISMTEHQAKILINALLNEIERNK